MMQVDFERRSFQFDDTFMDKIQCPGKFWVKQNTVNVVMDQLRPLSKGLLNCGESFRSPTFSVLGNHPTLSRMRFQLRVYPGGQFGSAQCFIVYLVLIEFTSASAVDQPKLPQLEVNLTVIESGCGQTVKVKSTKVFDWSVKRDRFLRLTIPWWKIQSNIEAFSVKLVLPGDGWKSYLQDDFLQSQIEELVRLNKMRNIELSLPDSSAGTEAAVSEVVEEEKIPDLVQHLNLQEEMESETDEIISYQHQPPTTLEEPPVFHHEPTEVTNLIHPPPSPLPQRMEELNETAFHHLIVTILRRCFNWISGRWLTMFCRKKDA